MAESMNVEQTRSRRWLARLSLLLALLAVVIVVVFADLHSIAMLAAGVVGAVVSLGAAFVFLSRRGVVRWLAAAAFVLAPAAVLVVFAFAGLSGGARPSAGSWARAGVSGRHGAAP